MRLRRTVLGGWGSELGGPDLGFRVQSAEAAKKPLKCIAVAVLKA